MKSYKTSFYNVIKKKKSNDKFLNLPNNTSNVTYIVDIKSSKSEIKNVFYKLFQLKVLKVRSLIMKKVSKYKIKKTKKVYITFLNNNDAD